MSELISAFKKFGVRGDNHEGYDSHNPDREWRSRNHRKIEVPRIPLNTPLRPDKIRIVCISDTHSRADGMRHPVPPEADILIHAGDFTRSGRTQEFADFDNYMASLHHIPHKIVIAGNHEVPLDLTCTRSGPASTKKRQSLLDLLKHCVYLEDSSVTVMGLKIYGSPWQPLHVGNAFQLNRGKEMMKKWDQIPTETDILITHGPPMGYGDLISGNYHVGCADLLFNVKDRVKPKYHIFGHIHEDNGQWTNGTTTFINASICNHHYQPINEPILIDIDLPPGQTLNRDHKSRGTN